VPFHSLAQPYLSKPYALLVLGALFCAGSGCVPPGQVRIESAPKEREGALVIDTVRERHA